MQKRRRMRWRGWRAWPTVLYVACRMVLRVTCCTLYDVARDALHVARRLVVRRMLACACRPAGRRDPPELVAVIRRDFQLAVLLTRPARRDRLQRIAPPAGARLSQCSAAPPAGGPAPVQQSTRALLPGGCRGTNAARHAACWHVARRGRVASRYRLRSLCAVTAPTPWIDGR